MYLPNILSDIFNNVCSPFFYGEIKKKHAKFVIILTFEILKQFEYGQCGEVKHMLKEIFNTVCIFYRTFKEHINSKSLMLTHERCVSVIIIRDSLRIDLFC